MRTRISLGFAALFLATAACSDSIFVSPDAGGGEDGGVVPVNGGGDGGFVDAEPPPNCDTTKLPTDNVCVVNDAEGIFVSSSMGSASGNGSQKSPLASLDAAIAMAKAAKRRVYACAENYAEQVNFADGVSVFGYFVCGSAWAVDASKHAKVNAPASPAATAANITTATRVEAVDLYAPDFTTASQSSIALVATGSPALTMANATIHAGTGGKGADGTNGIQLTDSGAAKNGLAARASALDGCNGNVLCETYAVADAAGGTNVCSGASGHNGGSGGAGGSGGKYQNGMFGWAALNGAYATAGSPTAPTTSTAQGGALGLGGAAGAPGANGMDGVSGLDFGTLSESGYVPSDGTNGTSGAPGQGGGGSGGYDDLNQHLPPQNYSMNVTAFGGAGASGGAGGCPGLSGTAAKGGGSSIAIVAISSPFALDGMTIESSSGGAGGAAGAAGAPTAGGLGGALAYDLPSGGSGGSGGLAGVSGNGGGGPSVGIAWQGGQPTQLASTVKPGAGGSGVAARLGTDGKTIPASTDGLSQAVYNWGQ